MKIRGRALPAALALAFGVALAAHADSTASARKAVQAAYDAQNAAAARRDVPGMMVFFTPDFQGTTPQGQTVTYAQQTQILRQLMTIAKSIKNTTRIRKFTMKGRTAAVTVQEHTTIVLVNPQTHQTGTLVSDDTSLDTWVKTGRGWKERRSKGLTMKETLNGKSVPERE